MPDTLLASEVPHFYFYGKRCEITRKNRPRPRRGLRGGWCGFLFGFVKAVVDQGDEGFHGFLLVVAGDV